MSTTRHRIGHAEDGRRRTAAGAVEISDEVQDSQGVGTPWRRRQVWRVRLLQGLQRLRGQRCDDRDLAFVVATFQQTSLLERCLADLRRFYPEAKVVVVADGDPDEYLDTVCERVEARLVRGERLKRPGLGGAYWKRLASEFSTTRCEYLVKIDPDSRFERRFRYLSRGEFFGTIIGHGTPFLHVQGGCQVLRSGTVRRWLDSGLLDDPRYEDVNSWCRNEVLRERLLAYEKDRGVLPVDHMLFDMMHRLGVKAAHWQEVACWWPHPPSCPTGLFAITHPHPLAPAASPAGETPLRY